MAQTTDTQNTETPSFHFYAANVGMWATTSESRDLPALIKLMEADKMTYFLYYVPLPETADYKIRFYQPEAEGAVYMGTFEPKTKAKRRK